MRKSCKHCKVEKDFSEFYRHKNMLDGFLSECKECVKKRMHRYWESGKGREVDRKRDHKPKRKEWKRLHAKKMRERHKAKVRVRHQFRTWFMKHKDTKKPCEACGTQEKLEAHHFDYNKPLEVIWLCSLHHKEWHRNNKPIYPITNV